MLTETIASTESQLIPPQHRVCVRIGEVSLALIGSFSGNICLSSELQEFASNDAPSDIEVHVQSAESLRPRTGIAEFDSGAVWKLFREQSHFAFDFTSTSFGPDPYKRMRVSWDLRRAEITLNRELLQSCGPVSPLEYPTDELLITNYLAHHGLGIEVHGCGLIDAESGGHLFLGHSEAGKSTTTRIWQSSRNPEVLSDDRLILRLHDGELWMYGTPWHGEAGLASPSKTKLSHIFVLQHGLRNEISAMTKAQAAGEVFARSFPPFHSALGLEHTLEFINRVLDVVPCYQFQFVPDESAVKAVLDFHD